MLDHAESAKLPCGTWMVVLVKIDQDISVKWINNMLCQCVGRLCSVDPLPMIRNRLGHQPSMEATAT